MSWQKALVTPGVTVKKLVRPGETRWFSSLMAFNSFAALRDAVLRFLVAEAEFSVKELLTDEDIAKLTAVCVRDSASIPLRLHCSAGCSWCDPSAQSHTGSGGLRKVLEIGAEEGPTAIAWKKEHLKDLEDRFRLVFQCQKLLPFCCAAIHPLYSSELSTVYGLSAAQVDAVWDKIREEAELLHAHIQTVVTAMPQQDLFSCKESEASEVSSFRAQLIPALQHVRALFSSAQWAQKKASPPPGDEKTVSDPFLCWRSLLHSRTDCAVLRPVMQLLLSIPASSANFERLWSSAGFLHENRENMTPEHLMMLTVIRDWLLAVPNEAVSAVLRALHAEVKKIQEKAASDAAEVIIQ